MTVSYELQIVFMWLKVYCVLSNVWSLQPVVDCRRWLWKEPVVMCGRWNVRQATSQQMFRVTTTIMLFVFFWANVNNLTYINNNVEKWLFRISQGKVATSDRWGGQICKISMSNFLRIQHTKNHKNRLIFDRVIQKRWNFWGTQRRLCILVCVCLRCHLLRFAVVALHVSLS